MHVACGRGPRKGCLGLSVLAVARRVVEGSTKKACTGDQCPALAQGCRLTSRDPLITSLFSCPPLRAPLPR
jgi:hypothetical protein